MPWKIKSFSVNSERKKILNFQSIKILFEPPLSSTSITLHTPGFHQSSYSNFFYSISIPFRFLFNIWLGSGWEDYHSNKAYARLKKRTRMKKDVKHLKMRKRQFTSCNRSAFIRNDCWSFFFCFCHGFVCILSHFFILLYETVSVSVYGIIYLKN